MERTWPFRSGACIWWNWMDRHEVWRRTPVETPDWIMPNPTAPMDEIVTVHRETATSGDVLEVRGDVLFEFGKADLRTGAELALDQAYFFIRDHPEFVRISIEGHTDNVGPGTFNKGLSERRAEAVLKWFQRNIGEADYNKRNWGTVGFGFSKLSLLSAMPVREDAGGTGASRLFCGGNEMTTELDPPAANRQASE